MSAINFPDPSQSPWTNSSTGITYTYSNGVWKALSSEETFLKTTDAESTYLKQADANFVSLSDGGTQQVISGGGGLNVDGDVQKKGNTVPSAVMGPSAPSNPGICDFWTDTSGDDPVLKSWNGTEWVEVGSSGPSEFAAVISNVTLTENDTTGDRFTSQTFDVDITMLREGEPFSQKGLKGEVTAEFDQYPVTEPIASNNVTYASNGSSPSISGSLTSSYGQGPLAYGPINSTQYGYIWLDFYESSSDGYVRVRTSTDLSQWPYGGTIAYTPSGMVYYLSQTRYGQYFPPTPAYDVGFYLFNNGPTHSYAGGSSVNKVGVVGVNSSGTIDQFFTIERLGKTIKDSTGKHYYLTPSMQCGRSDIPIGADASEVLSSAAPTHYTSGRSTLVGIANGYVVAFYWSNNQTLRSARLPVNFNSYESWEVNTVMSNDTNDVKAVGAAGGYFWIIKNRTIFRSSDGYNWTNLGELGNTGAGQYYYIVEIRENPSTGATEFMVYYDGNSYIYSSNNGGGSWTIAWNGPGTGNQSVNFYNSQMIWKSGGGTRTLKAWTWGAQTVTLDGQGSDYVSFNVGDTIHPLGNYDDSAYGRITNISGNNISIASDYIYQAGDVIEGLNSISSGVSSRYLVIDATGAVSGTVGSDPGYVGVGPNTSKTLTFPATFPSGNSPDDELPVGTTLKVSAQATNSIGSSEFGPSNVITPA